MRYALVIAATCLIAGCGTDDDSWGVPQRAPAAQVSSETAESAPAAPAADAAQHLRPDEADTALGPDYQEHCKSVALQRAEDARANGYDPDTVRMIYGGTFKDCLKWDRAHGEE